MWWFTSIYLCLLSSWMTECERYQKQVFVHQRKFCGEKSKEKSEWTLKLVCQTGLLKIRSEVFQTYWKRKVKLTRLLCSQYPVLKIILHIVVIIIFNPHLRIFPLILEREKERNINVREKYQLVASHMHPIRD